MKDKKIAIAISGGVDSAVAASLLKREYKEVAGFFLYFWEEGEYGNNNLSREYLDARLVCEKLKIKFYPLNAREMFHRKIVEYFIKEYKDGRTPNPCVRCNKFIKIKWLLDCVKDLGYDYLATGHYVRKELGGKTQELWRGIDANKDQSYFLYNIKQNDLYSLLFPLGVYNKTEVRKKAEELGLKVAEKKDSQEVCFLKNKSLSSFLNKHIGKKSGDIVLKSTNKVVAKHSGLHLYTKGQRRGIDVGGTGPYYVVDFDYKKNILYIDSHLGSDILFSDKLSVSEFNFLKEDVKFPLKTSAVIRYGQKPISCTVKEKNNILEVKFSEKVRAITAGQSVVFYDEDRVIGGGVIK